MRSTTVSGTSQRARARLSGRSARLVAVDARCLRRRRHRRPARLTAPRVLDTGTAPALAARVQAAAARHGRVTVDLRHVVAVDAAGLRTLRRLADRLPVVLQGPSHTALVRLGVSLAVQQPRTRPNA